MEDVTVGNEEGKAQTENDEKGIIGLKVKNEDEGTIELKVENEDKGTTELKVENEDKGTIELKVENEDKGTIELKLENEDKDLKIERSELSGKSSVASHNQSENVEFLMDENLSLGSKVSRKKTASETFCRICHDYDADEVLISPCRCWGSLSRVHRSCLERWLAESDSSHCELCGFKYQTQRKPKYSLLGSILAWYRNSRRDRREVVLDFLATVAIAPLAGLGTYIGLLMAETLDIEEDIQDLSIGTITGRIAALSVISLMTTLDIAYATWAAVRLQFHINNWYAWYRRNTEVTLIDIEDSHGH